MVFLKDLWQFIKERRNYWLIPVIIFVLIIGLVTFFVGGTAIAPFIYTLF